MPNHLAHFAIAADDVERARRFYERVFGWRIEAWGPPDFYMVFTDPDKPHGSIAKRADLAAARGEQPSRDAAASDGNAPSRSMTSSAIKSAIVKHGGKIVHDEREIVGVGTLIRFEDTEGNIACAMHYV